MASLLNFLLMQELVESLKRDGEEQEEKQREEASPKNFFQVDDYKAWRGGQEACKREQMVIALEITDQFSDSSGRVRPLFLRLAKEFDSIPFLRVLTGPGRRLTTDKIQPDIGAVNAVPTILLLYYVHPDHIKRKTYQGERAIREALQNGELKKKLKEFIDARLEQKSMGSLKPPEKEYRERLSTLSKSLSKDELVQKRRRLPSEGSTTEDFVPYSILERNEEPEDDDNTDSKTATKHHSDREASETVDDDSVSDPSLKLSVSPPTTSSRPPISYMIDRKEIVVGDIIGQGAFGAVYEAKWMKKKVAVKVCSGNVLDQSGATREVEILASLPPHPNVLTFFGVSLSEDKISSLIVTELAIGGSLYTCLHGKERKEPSADQSIAWAIQIADGMEHLHGHHIIHRDLKSHNVLLLPGKVAKICDFGTARQLAQTYVQTNQAGTHRWMAPEIAEYVEAKISNKCDIFSYGMILYEIFALKVPFAHIPGDARVSNAIIEGERPSVPDKLPPFLVPVLLDCWKKEPSQRPSFKSIIMTLKTESYEKDI